MRVWVEAVVSLRGDEDSLIDAVTWLLSREFSPKPEDELEDRWDFIDVRIKDAGDWVKSLHRSMIHEPEDIGGTIQFSYHLAERLKFPRMGLYNVEFTSELADVGGEEGIIVTLGKPINQRYHIKGLEREEFQIVKVEPFARARETTW